MTRAERLLTLLQILRRHRRPVTGVALAGELGVSLRTLYRDIASLQAQGAPIEGAAGVGYVLQPGFMLPPLMFTLEELDAIALGAHWVAGRGDTALGAAAQNALAKIAAVIPSDTRDKLRTSALIAAPADVARDKISSRVIREAIHKEQKLRITYLDGSGTRSERVIWPLRIGVFEQVRVVIAWCEIRQDFRHFRTDRIEQAELIIGRYPARRFDLLRRWKAQEGITLSTDPADIF